MCVIVFSNSLEEWFFFSLSSRMLMLHTSRPRTESPSQPMSKPLHYTLTAIRPWILVIFGGNNDAACFVCVCLLQSSILLVAMAVFCLDFIVFPKIYRLRSFLQLCLDACKTSELLLRSKDLLQIGLLAVGVLISKLHAWTRCRKSSFIERSFTIDCLSVQFLRCQKVRVNNL